MFTSDYINITFTDFPIFSDSPDGRKFRDDICMRCHRSGHKTADCPDKPRGRSGNNPPPDPCWSCGELHWAHECEIQKQRSADGVCILCGDGNHWLRACSLYDPAVHVRKNTRPGEKSRGSPKVSYVVPRRAKIPWCLRCGNDQHHTADCTSNDPPVNFPPDADGDKWKEICLWCGVRGHTLTECWKRAPVETQANSNAIASMQDEMKGIKKSLANVERLQTNVDSLSDQMQRLVEWQQSEANPAITLAKKTATLADTLTRRVDSLEQDFMQKSAFQKWLDGEFQGVKEVAHAALPRSEFESFLAQEEEELRGRSSISQGDAEMERAALTGQKRANEEPEDTGSPAARAKRRHGKGTQSQPASPPSTPGSDAFGAMGPPKTPERTPDKSQDTRRSLLLTTPDKQITS